MRGKVHIAFEEATPARIGFNRSGTFWTLCGRRVGGDQVVPELTAAGAASPHWCQSCKRVWLGMGRGLPPREAREVREARWAPGGTR